MNVYISFSQHVFSVSFFSFILCKLLISICFSMHGIKADIFDICIRFNSLVRRKKHESISIVSDELIMQLCDSFTSVQDDSAYSFERKCFHLIDFQLLENYEIICCISPRLISFQRSICRYFIQTLNMYHWKSMMLWMMRHLLYLSNH